MTLTAVVRDRVESWLDAHDRHAPGSIEGLYLVGSVALGDWTPHSDVDIVAFLAEPATDSVAALLEVAHGAAAGAPSVDGPRLAWGDVSMPPGSAMRPWTLDGEFHFDAECFEVNPVTWYTLATYGVAVRGPAPEVLGVHLDAADRSNWVRDNLETYWRSVAESVDAALADRARTEFRAEMQEWCVAGVSRMRYTLATGDVASKSAAATWAAEQFPQHGSVIRQALDIRHRDGEAGFVGRDAVIAASAFLRDAIEI